MEFILFFIMPDNFLSDWEYLVWSDINAFSFSSIAVRFIITIPPPLSGDFCKHTGMKQMKFARLRSILEDIPYVKVKGCNSFFNVHARNTDLNTYDTCV